MEWLSEKNPYLATSLYYCCTLDEVRTTLNAATGLEIAPEEDQEIAFDRWKAALET